MTLFAIAHDLFGAVGRIAQTISFLAHLPGAHTHLFGPKTHLGATLGPRSGGVDARFGGHFAAMRRHPLGVVALGVRVTARVDGDQPGLAALFLSVNAGLFGVDPGAISLGARLGGAAPIGGRRLTDDHMG